MARKANIPKFDFLDTKDYFGVTEVKVVYDTHEAYMPIEKARLIHNLVSLDLKPEVLNVMVLKIEDALDEAGTLFEINERAAE